MMMSNYFGSGSGRLGDLSLGERERNFNYLLVETVKKFGSTVNSVKIG